jgi:6-phosphogluconolactonase
MDSNAQQNMSYFFVSSASADHPSGIAFFSMDNKTGKVAKINEFNQVSGSSYLVISNDNEKLYTIGQKKGDINGTLSSFFLIDGGKELDPINETEIPGSGPCYISLNETNSVLMVADYPQGNIVTFKVDSDGFIGNTVSNIYHHGSGINKERQEGPHPHMIIQLPGTNMVLVPDLGIDKIMLYQMDNDGKLTPGLQPYAEVAPGSGPRHFSMHPGGKFGYLINELNSTVTAFEIDKENEGLSRLNTVSILPEEFKDFNKSADILVSPDGNYVYATNRGHNSIAILKVDQKTGKIEFIKTVSCGGDYPRAFRLDPSGQFLLVANKNSGDIVTFKIDSETGDLEMVHKNNSFPGPQCIRFLH